MLKGYKRSYLVINIILTIVMTILGTNLFVFKESSYIFCILSVLIPFSIITLRYGYEKKKRRFMYELIFYIFAYTVLFLLVTYLIGISTGFTKNVYKLNLSNVIHNIIPYLFLIFISELFRYEITRKGDGSPLSYVLVTIILIMIDLTLFLKTYNLNSGDEQIKYLCAILLPSIFKNIVLIYFTRIGGYVPSFIYRIILDLKLVLLPIFPNFGLYFECTINCILPVFILICVELNLKKFRNKENENYNIKNNFTYRYLVFFVIIVLAVGINLLSSGKLKYNMISIGSGSMTPKINKGDAIVYERLGSHELEVGEILVFKKEKKIVVHRIIEIVELSNHEKIYYTKGDANEAPDGYPIEKKDILGFVKFRIRYIGIPSVALGEAIKK